MSGAPEEFDGYQLEFPDPLPPPRKRFRRANKDEPCEWDMPAHTGAGGGNCGGTVNEDPLPYEWGGVHESKWLKTFKERSTDEERGVRP